MAFAERWSSARSSEMERDQLAAHALAYEFDSCGRRTSIIYDLDQSILPTSSDWPSAAGDDRAVHADGGDRRDETDADGNRVVFRIRHNLFLLFQAWLKACW